MGVPSPKDPSYPLLPSSSAGLWSSSSNWLASRQPALLSLSYPTRVGSLPAHSLVVCYEDGLHREGHATNPWSRPPPIVALPRSVGPLRPCFRRLLIRPHLGQLPLLLPPLQCAPFELPCSLPSARCSAEQYSTPTAASQS